MAERPLTPAAGSPSELTAAMPGTSPTIKDASGAVRAPIDGWREGQLLGEFKLLRRLGQGGMASVWLAEQTSLHRNVALKLLRPDLMADETYVKRFQTEAKAAAGLNHPNIVQVYIIGEAEGQHFIAQEYVQGNTLKSFVQKKGPVDLQLGLHLMRQVAGALQAAGERGIVHRDIKPENIMLTRKGEAKVADFGLAQLTHGTEKLNLTQEGVTMGTPLYMSPEQVNGKKLDARSDIYSFGVTCYHMFAGRPPFLGETAVSVAVQHLQDEPRPLKELRPDLPQTVCDLIHRMMAKLPDQRYPDAATVLEDVRKLIKALKESSRLDQVKLAELEPASRTSGTFAARHPVLTLSLLCLLAGGLSAGLGWWKRPVDPLREQAKEDFGVPQRATAREQFLQAMFDGNNEDAWLAVIHYHEDTKSSNEEWIANQEWIARTHEQLALLYLRDKDRRADAQRELEALKKVGGPTQEAYFAKACAGEAALAIYQKDYVRGRQMLEKSRKLFEKYQLWPEGADAGRLPSPWRRLLSDALAQVREHEQGPTS